jgi:hypothetical protein
MLLPNDVARCADALDNNCQFRHNCKRWVYRKPKQGNEDHIVWSNFAKDQVDNKEGICLYQIRID